MGDVLHFHGHRWLRHRECDNEPGRCFICDGGLSYCEVCCTGEINIPTDCPGRPCTTEEQDDIAAGIVDYNVKMGGWVTPGRAENGGAF